MLALTTRQQDEIYTRKLEQFMDMQYKKQNLLTYMERVKDRQMQLHGIDIVLDDETGIKYIDEKFAIDYRFKDLQTYSFELSSGNNWNEGGWFLNHDSLTTHYLLLWFQSDEDITEVYKYDACLISKEKIYQMLRDDHINPYEALEEFRAYFANNSEGSVGMKFHVVVNRDGSSKKRMAYNGYVISQSDRKVEAPINLIIPKWKLLKYADVVMTCNETLDVDNEISRVKDTNIEMPQNVTTYIDDKAIKLLQTKNIVSGNMWLVFPDGQKKQMQIKNIPHETKLVIKNKETKKETVVAVYDKKFGEWAIVANGFDYKSIGKAKASPYKEYIKSIIRAGYVPIGFEYMDKMHNRIPVYENLKREHGHKIVSTREYTGGVKVVIAYDDFTESFVLNDNPYITSKFISKIGNTRVISDAERAKFKAYENYRNA